MFGSTLYWIGSALTVFLIGLLLTRKRKAAGDYYLAAWLTILLTQLVLHTLLVEGYSFESSLLLGWERVVPFVHGPLLVLYVTLATRTQERLSWKSALVFAPLALVVAAQIPFTLLSASEKVRWYFEHRDDSFLENGWDVATFAFGIAYLVAAVFVFASRWQKTKELAGYEPVTKSLTATLTGFFFVWASLPFQDLVRPIVSTWTADNDWITYAVSIPVVYFLTRTESKYAHFRLELKAPERKPAQSYSKSGLSEIEKRRIQEKLTTFLAETRAYRDPMLTLTKLAKQIHVAPSYLSEVLNTKLDLGFYDYVNQYRLDEFLRRVGDIAQRKETILTLAYSCGFSSKSTFNLYFKTKMQMTPSQYIKTDFDRVPAIS